MPTCAVCGHEYAVRVRDRTRGPQVYPDVEGMTAHKRDGLLFYHSE